MQMGIDDLDPNTIRVIADSIEDWLPRFEKALEAGLFYVLTPSEVCAIIQGGIVDSMREQAVDIGRYQAGLLSDGDSA